MDEDEFLKNQIRNLNRHLPKGRPSLAKLLSQEKPEVESKDGSVHRFKREELEKLAEITNEEERKRLRLPIIIRISTTLGRGTAKISGKLERKILREFLEKEETEGDELVIYKPEIRKIRRILPTTTQYAFLISSRGNRNEMAR